MKNLLKLIGLAASVVSIPSWAATPPYVQIVGSPTQLAATCKTSSVSPRVQVNINLPAGTLATWSIASMQMVPYTDYYGYVQYDYMMVPIYNAASRTGPVTNTTALIDVGTPSLWYSANGDSGHVTSVPDNTTMVLTIYAHTPQQSPPGYYSSSASFQWDCSSGQVSGIMNTDNAAGNPDVTVSKTKIVEFYNATLDHYFISAAAAEIAALDSGATVGWRRTGQEIGAFAATTAGAGGVCRFYIPPGLGDSHFYSVSTAECSAVASKFPAFTLESSAVFYVVLPDFTTGACPPTTAPVFRLWNQRADSNHRYTTDPTIKAQMIAAGYVPEGYGPNGVTMCGPM